MHSAVEDQPKPVTFRGAHTMSMTILYHHEQEIYILFSWSYYFVKPPFTWDNYIYDINMGINESLSSITDLLLRESVLTAFPPQL
jgi:hypothetical protein